MPRRDKRADIVNAGIRIFSRKGFNRCSVEDILQEAHVARATFYSYFDSKKDLFVELVDGILNTMFEIAARELGDIPSTIDELKEKTRNTLLALYRYFSENWEFSAIYIKEVMGMNPEIDYRIVEWQQRMAEMVKVLLTRGVKKGIFRSIDADIVAPLVAGVPQHLGLQLFMIGKNVDIPRIADAVTDYLIYGLAVRN